jgi:hypothetical protein
VILDAAVVVCLEERKTRILYRGLASGQAAGNPCEVMILIHRTWAFSPGRPWPGFAP